MSFKKIILIVLFFIPHLALPQNFGWITPNQAYLKMYVADDGMYRINKSDFINAGVITSGLDPRTIKLYYKGNQIPIYFWGEQDGIFDDTDYFDFYGIRNYGGLTNVYTSTNAISYQLDEFFDLYSDTSVYWVGWGGNSGLRYVENNYSTTLQYPYNYFYKKLHFEKDSIYSPGEIVNDVDYRYYSTERFQGEGWYWRQFLYNNSYSQSFLSLFRDTLVQAKLKFFAYPYNQSTSIVNEHRLIFKINNYQFDTIKTDNFRKFDTTVFFSSSNLNLLSSNTITIRYLPPPSFTAGRLYFDMFEIFYPRNFYIDSSFLSFEAELTDTTSRKFTINGYNSSNYLYIYDNKNYQKIVNYSSSGSSLFFSGKGNGKFEIINNDIQKKPFRIKKRQVPDLISSSNGADYLIIYNKLFETSAENLRQHRQTHNGFRAFKSEVEDIFDIFNFGIENPVALKRFVSYVYSNWQTPKLKFLCLFGRGSLDPKKNSLGSVFYNNYVPVYGNPASDGYYANFNQGAFTYTQQIAVGRLPAFTSQEAQDMVNNIISYENQNLDSWIKQPIMISGGYDYSSQQVFVAQSNNFINTYLSPRPLSLKSQKIYLNDPSGLVTYPYSDSIKNSINRGSILVNYMAHAGNGYWDFVFNDPSILSNGYKMPLIFSMTCFTGKNAETSSRGYGENFIRYAGKGAIGFISTTGTSFSGSGNTFNDYLIRSVRDTLRYTGDIMSNSTKLMSANNDTTSFVVRNTINSYNLLGDPAVKILLPNYPEFDITQNDYSISTSTPSINEAVQLSISPKNLGTFADSCKIRFQLLKNSALYKTRDTIIRNLDFQFSVNHNFSLDSSGTYEMKIILDVDNWYPRELKANNSITIPLYLKNLTFVPLKPLDNQVLSSGMIEFSGLNPWINSAVYPTTLLLQLDTARSFSSPMLSTYFRSPAPGSVSKFNINLNTTQNPKLYYWRMNSVINGDSAGWSKPNRLIINLSEDINRSRGLINTESDSIIIISKNFPEQYESFELNRLKKTVSGLQLNEFSSTIRAQSDGYQPYMPSYVNIGSLQIAFSDEVADIGLNLLKVNKKTSKLISLKNFKVTTTQSSDSVISYLNTFDTTHILVLCKVFAVPGGTMLSVAARNKIKEFGSIYADSLRSPSGFSWYDTWSMIGYQGALPGQVPEGFYKYPGGAVPTTPAICEQQIQFLYTTGYVNNIIGPSKEWKSFSWNQIINQNTDIKFDVFGINRNNQNVLLIENVSTNNYVDLQSINSYQYPYLNIIGKLFMDSVMGYSSPVLSNINMRYIPAGDISIDKNSLILSDSIVYFDTAGIFARYYNVGYADINGVIRNLFVYNNGNKVIIRSDTINSVLKVDSSGVFKKTIKVKGLPVNPKYRNRVDVFLEILPLNAQNELNSYNNIVNANFIIEGVPGIYNDIALYSDGIKLNHSGDYVRINPDMTLIIKNEKDSAINFDTIPITMFVNSENLASNKDSKEKNMFKYELSGKEMQINFSPVFKEGVNEIKFIVNDNIGFNRDTIKYTVNVSTEFALKNLYNFPNPMKNETSFSFELSGMNNPTSCSIKIYSSAGRLIKIINIPAVIGYNNISWDGRDEDGDYIANGVYFYKLIVNADSKRETALQKLVVLR